ncbi:sulfatase [Natrinema pellirubrum DSM 15624]|uniref:Sulfatase n=1 Tax=Natrinema pellirubrum (strain DSM 15624 / CIP 106293 / JCM 10476 / NCIMB 786 / 157) TaxID=797303 RepID=L0JIK3_NATP1|nr:sulfatase-like hydrolase/transferase [Natrinema pellirubrum]AGB30382.1 arylsulfatase A family protein [Natrinema pellirubrum DSM 15624]ELY79390.1 sulfatase [Natrinema pellirubrum DSM 15624]
MADSDSRPNVLFVLTDQERYDASAPDGPPVETEAIDSLSSEGVRFQQAVTPISICSSARASLLTGQFPHGHGMLNNCHEPDAIREDLPDELPTFSEELVAAGYDLTYTGKWHAGRERTPADFGFSYLGGSDTHHDDIDEAFREYRRERGTPVGEVALEGTIYTGEDPRDGENGTFVAAKSPIDVEETRAYFLAERTIDAIESHADGDRDGPFFHRTDFYGPHHPYVVPEPYASMYDPDDIEPPDSYAETYDGKPRVHENYLAYRGVADFDWELWAEALAKYWGFLTMIDHQLERILGALDDHGLADETVVVHASDHGDFAGSHRQFNKGPLMYDDTYRIPLQIRWPGVTDGATCETPVHLHDLAATFLEIAEVPVPESFDSRSLVPLLENGGEPPADLEWRDSTFAQYHGDEFGLYSQRMVRTAAYKYVYNGPDMDELYDLEADPAELRNLIDHPEYETVRTNMRERLTEWMDETDDPNRVWVSGVLENAS